MKRDLFSGRYGVDPLSIFVLCLAVLCFTSHYVWILGVLLIAWVIFRALSKNLDKRRRELWLFTGVMQKLSAAFQRFAFELRPFFRKIGNGFSLLSLKWRYRKQYVYLKCPRCKKVLRLPRGRGMLAVKCTVCGYSFRKKT